jgi:hypothetical protein
MSIESYPLSAFDAEYQGLLIRGGKYFRKTT